MKILVLLFLMVFSSITAFAQNAGIESRFDDAITHSSRSISPIFGEENYEKTERLKYLEAKRAFTNNPTAYLEAATGAKMNNMPPVKVSESFDFLEIDYR